VGEQTDRVREFVKEMSRDVPGSAPCPSDADFSAYLREIDTAERQLRRAAYTLHLQGRLQGSLLDWYEAQKKAGTEYRFED
jgi:hypothetical protein